MSLNINMLAIDVGNTNITFALSKGKNIIKKFSLPTKNYCLARIRKRLSNPKETTAIICSVVPEITKRLEKDLKGLLKKQPYIIGKDIKVPIKNLYRNPRQVGQDRLVNAYAGIMLYGVPLIVIDFGTAITFDVISRNKEYLGGIILPGLAISLDALYQKTALLPKIKLDRPKELIGRDTKNSILSGAVYGFSALIDDLRERIKAKIGKDAKVIVTGGDVDLVAKYSHKINKIDKDLILKGMNLIYEKSQKSCLKNPLCTDDRR